MQQDNPTIPADLMRELIGPVGDTLDGYTCVDDYEDDDSARWGESRRIVVRHDATGRYYQARYVAVSGDEGGVELDADGDRVPVVEVEPVEVTAIAWSAVDTSAE